MTFGEKLQKLRREAGLSQEELAERLEVSRQAVSKWERDSGYPETEKIIRMGRLFHVTMDYLLNEDAADAPAADPAQPAGSPAPEETAAPEPPEAPASEAGFYVDRETAVGFLTHRKARLWKIALAAGLLVGSLGLAFWSADWASVAFMAAWIAALVLVCAAGLSGDPYRRLRQEPLVLDSAVRAELGAAYDRRRGLLHGLTLTGVTLAAVGLLLCPLLLDPAEYAAADTLVMSAGMVAAGVGFFLVLYAGGLLRAYRLLLPDENHHQKGT